MFIGISIRTQIMLTLVAKQSENTGTKNDTLTTKLTQVYL